MDEKFREFHAKELFDLRQYIGRWQDQRANFERNAITAILAIWTFAAGYSQKEAGDFISLFIWWIPVIACWFTMKRIESYENTIRQVIEYLKPVYNEVAAPELRGWLAWRDENLKSFSKKAGQTETTKNMWSWMLAISTFIAIVATFSVNFHAFVGNFNF